jgi:hypothetical protein
MVIRYKLSVHAPTQAHTHQQKSQLIASTGMNTTIIMMIIMMMMMMMMMIIIIIIIIIIILCVVVFLAYFHYFPKIKIGL